MCTFVDLFVEALNPDAQNSQKSAKVPKTLFDEVDETLKLFDNFNGNPGSNQATVASSGKGGSRGSKKKSKNEKSGSGGIGDKESDDELLNMILNTDINDMMAAFNTNIEKKAKKKKNEKSKKESTEAKKRKTEASRLVGRAKMIAETSRDPIVLDKFEEIIVQLKLLFGTSDGNSEASEAHGGAKRMVTAETKLPASINSDLGDFQLFDESMLNTFPDQTKKELEGYLGQINAIRERFVLQIFGGAENPQNQALPENQDFGDPDDFDEALQAWQADEDEEYIPRAVERAVTQLEGPRVRTRSSGRQNPIQGSLEGQDTQNGAS